MFVFVFGMKYKGKYAGLEERFVFVFVVVFVFVFGMKYEGNRQAGRGLGKRDQ